MVLTSKAVVITALNTAAPTTKTLEGVYWHLEQTIGSLATKTITLSANNDTASENVFQITGNVDVVRLYAEVVDVTTLANCTNIHFDLYDSTAAVDITKSGPGSVLSGLAVGTFLVKDAIKTTAVAIADNATGVVSEASGNKPFTGFFVTQKTGANTYLRLTYTTTDAPINAQITVYCDYIALGSATLVAV